MSRSRGRRQRPRRRTDVTTEKLVSILREEKEEEDCRRAFASASRTHDHVNAAAAARSGWFSCLLSVQYALGV